MSDKQRAGVDGLSPTNDRGRDLDILDRRFVDDPAAVWRELRDGCPVAFTERRGRPWMPVRYDDIAAIANDTTHFSSRRVGVIDSPDSQRGDRPLLMAPPITSDPPDHTWARRILLPAFSPHQIEVMTPITRRSHASSSTGSPTRAGGRRAGLRPAHPGTRDRPHARGAGERRGHVHRLGGVDPPRGVQRPRSEPRRDHRSGWHLADGAVITTAGRFTVTELAQRAPTLLGGRGPLASVVTSAADTMQHFGRRGGD